MDDYLERFENYATVPGLSKEELAVRLSALLMGLMAFTVLSANESNEYKLRFGHSEVISTDQRKLQVKVKGRGSYQ